MIELYLEKLYRYERKEAPLGICIPVKKGRLMSADEVAVWDGKTMLPTQVKVTSRYEDGSVRFLYVRFIGNLPANKGYKFYLTLDKKDAAESNISNSISEKPSTKLCVEKNGAEISVDTGAISFTVKDYSDTIFTKLCYNGEEYTEKNFCGPLLKDGEQNYEAHFDNWQVVDEGSCAVILKCVGENVLPSCGCEANNHYKFEVRLTAFAGKSYIDVAYRIINTSEKPLHVASLTFMLDKNPAASKNMSLKKVIPSGGLDSTGCGDMDVDVSCQSGPIYHTVGIGSLGELEKLATVNNIRTCAGHSNYRTDFLVGRDGNEVNAIVDAADIVAESNEHIPDVLYGTFFADRTDEKSGICATIFQAQQNYPKAVKADKDGVTVYLVPENTTKIVMQPGMSRQQRFELYFHESSETLTEIDNRSLIYQMPDRPVISPKVYAQSGATTDVYTDRLSAPFETMLIGRADGHNNCFGMLNFGDSVDGGYTSQGRGGGSPVFSNNEYDYPHACALMYFRTGVRRFMDYVLNHASHWMDVDICHYSSDPLRIGGMIEHTKGHVVDGVLVPSHEWVEGLIDYYHLTGDERGLETAIGIGDNVLRLLETPKFQAVGEANARETGWALRTLVALYTETNDEKWRGKCEWIVGHFMQWRAEYGCFVAPYTDNTLIRTGFMISVAVGSLMRYYRIAPSEQLKELIMSAVDDIYDNCILDCGLFYYKELPSLTRLGNNTLLLESMSVGYEFTGDTKYLEAGKGTLIKALKDTPKGYGGSKKIIDDGVHQGSDSTKTFAQSFYPLTVFYNSLVKANMADFVDNY